MPKRSRKNKYGQIRSAILDLMMDIGGLVPYPIEMPYSYIRRIRYADRYQLDQAMYNMKRIGLIRQDKPKRKYVLTDSGRTKILLRRFLQSESRKHLANGNRTFIIFDMPEEYKRVRDRFRRMMLKSGFVLIQKSVMAGGRRLNSDFFHILRVLKIDKYIHVIEGKFLK